MRIVIALVVAVALAVAGYFWVVLSWSYSTGERVGWVQKLSKKGWICKTWEGELTMISMPGAVPEKFQFTVRDDAVADRINRAMGKRVALHYEEKVGLPTSCFGDTRYFVTRVTEVQDDSARTGHHGPGARVTSSAVARSGPAEELRSDDGATNPWRDPRVPARRSACSGRSSSGGRPRRRTRSSRASLMGAPGPIARRATRPGALLWDSAAWASRRAIPSCPGCPMARMPSASGSGSTTSVPLRANQSRLPGRHSRACRRQCRCAADREPSST